jgi:hypothetical protein
MLRIEVRVTVNDVTSKLSLSMAAESGLDYCAT